MACVRAFVREPLFLSVYFVRNAFQTDQSVRAALCVFVTRCRHTQSRLRLNYVTWKHELFVAGIQSHHITASTAAPAPAKTITRMTIPRVRTLYTNQNQVIIRSTLMLHCKMRASNILIHYIQYRVSSFCETFFCVSDLWTHQNYCAFDIYIYI